MQQINQPFEKNLVLVGGGHSHAIALRMWAMNPLPGLRVTLITDTSHTPYSGMLPGHVAGFYSFAETHIDLRRLTQFAQVEMYLDRAIGLDLEQQQVICQHHPPVNFDYLSLDIGSTPATISVPGAKEYAIAAKPVPQFLQAWERILAQAAQQPQQPLSLAIVGGGAGGVELALNMQCRLQQILSPNQLTIHLFHRHQELLSGHNRWVRERLQSILRQRGVKLHLGEVVSEVLPQGVVCASGLSVDSDYTFWVTQASAPGWIKASGLAADSQGFVLVQDTLQSVSHPQVLAAGDIATMENYQRPKAGVFAVRQGKPLFENLRHLFLGETLAQYIPQSRYLALIGTGDRQAIASWGNLGWQSSLLWRWKDRIDRKFMTQFSDLPAMNLPNNSASSAMYCAGCGAKVGSTTLKQVLQRLNLTSEPNIIIGLDTPDDAAVVQIPQDKLLVHTIDHFPAFINDPFILGQITANHCLSDIWAMGATAQTALAVATIPHGVPAQVAEILYQLLAGATNVLQEAKTALVGGHTTEGDQLSFGLACNGFVAKEHLLPKGGMKPGQVLILTKALGTGTILAANMRYQAQGWWLEEAIASMLLINQAAAQILSAHGATAVTDITGFGLLGHLWEMLQASQVSVKLNLEAIPALPGALECFKQGYFSSLHSQNSQIACQISNGSQFSTKARYRLLFDPQTAGGFLATIPFQQADSCLEKLKEAGYSDSQIIGEVCDLDPAMQPIKISE